MTPREYLNCLTTSRALYCSLFEAAASSFPPVSGSGAPLEELWCGLSQRELAKRLGQSCSMVSEDIRRLVQFRWVRREGRASRFILGSVGDGRFHLYADIAAKEMTGEDKLVSRTVLSLPMHRISELQRTENVGRGLDRRWTA